jgi:thiol-disulfide isomerase/thioredoxin
MSDDKQKDLEQIEKNINNLSNTLEKLTGNLGPLMDFSDLGKSMEKLKNVVPKSPSVKEDDGETCIHGNSWHSGCSDCDGMSAMDHVFQLVEEYPNDMELGKAIRELYNMTNSDKTEE